MKKIKTGLAAFGMSGQIFHAPFISTNPVFELTAITERSKELSKERYPSARIVRSFDELIAMDELELIVVNTPDSTHYEYARKALEAGKHVIVEKPFTTTVEQGQYLIDLAKSKGLALSVYQNRRWDSDFLTIKEVLNKGLLGRLVEFESTFPRYRNFIKEGTWKETGEMGGGLTYNLGAHVIDQAVQLFGVPEAIFADIDIIRTGGLVDDYFVIHLLRPSKAPNVKITLKSSYLMCEPEPRFVLHGTEGSFVKYGLDRQEADLNAGYMPNSPNWGVEDETIWGLLHTEKAGQFIQEKYPSLPGNYAGFYDNIYRHLRLGETLQTDATEVLPIIHLIEAAWESSKRKEVIRLSL
ncbi:MAG: Gfo/Idh/MocA family oxidoreductase [Parabacteroides sp.]|nr:Gfo/Idh/MocA family oxidoreductase [Parabacteroides sp.]